MKYHLNLEIDIALERLDNGVNLFENFGGEDKVRKELLSMKEKGLKYITGDCDNKDSQGACLGHR